MTATISRIAARWNRAKVLIGSLAAALVAVLIGQWLGRMLAAAPVTVPDFLLSLLVGVVGGCRHEVCEVWPCDLRQAVETVGANLTEARAGGEGRSCTRA